MPKRPNAHRPPGWKPSQEKRKEYRRENDRNRPSARQRGYTWAWEQARKQFLAVNPLCVHCQANGVIKPANEVDHIQPHKGDRDLFWDVDNLQALCKPCHSKKTARGL